MAFDPLLNVDQVPHDSMSNLEEIITKNLYQKSVVDKIFDNLVNQEQPAVLLYGP
jgi:hypothetical protein